MHVPYDNALDLHEGVESPNTHDNNHTDPVKNMSLYLYQRVAKISLTDTGRHLFLASLVANIKSNLFTVLTTQKTRKYLY